MLKKIDKDCDGQHVDAVARALSTAGAAQATSAGSLQGARTPDAQEAQMLFAGRSLASTCSPSSGSTAGDAQATPGHSSGEPLCAGSAMGSAIAAPSTVPGFPGSALEGASFSVPASGEPACSWEGLHAAQLSTRLIERAPNQGGAERAGARRRRHGPNPFAL